MYLVCPDLASNWVANPGFTEWEFTIRPNVTWHDGEPFTAEDVQFWYGLAADGWESDGAPVRAPAYFRGDLGDIESVEVLEFNRVRVTLAEPNPHYLTVLANPRLRIAHPKHLMAPSARGGRVQRRAARCWRRGHGAVQAGSLRGRQPGSRRSER